MIREPVLAMRPARDHRFRRRGDDYDHHIFFRRYGLDDRTTTLLNFALLFVVLFYVCPLKFLMARRAPAGAAGMAGVAFMLMMPLQTAQGYLRGRDRRPGAGRPGRRPRRVARPRPRAPDYVVLTTSS